MSVVYRNISVVDIVEFIHNIFLFYVILFIKGLLSILPDHLFECISSRMTVCEIDTVDSGCESEEEDIISGDESEDTEEEYNRALEKKLLSFLIESNIDKINKYKTPDYSGTYKINTAVVFKSKDNKINELIRITNKLFVWCRLFPKKLYCSDIIKLANLEDYIYENKNINIYLFLIVEEYNTGYNYKYIANLTTKKIIPSYKDIMFSRIQINSI